jgi:hypothetical protein
MIRVDFRPFVDTGPIAVVATLEEAKRGVGFRYPSAAFALSWRSHYLPNPGWRRATLDVWGNAYEQARDYHQERVVAKLVNESDEPPGPDEKLDGNQLPSEVPKEPNPRNLIERKGILMMIVPVIRPGGDGDGSDGLFWCFVVDESRTKREPPKSQQWGFVPVVNREGQLMQFSSFDEAVEEGFALGELLFRGKV